VEAARSPENGVVIDDVAARGFGSESSASTYEQYRPSYPLDAVDWLVDRFGLGPGATVVDVGAGTGKLTRLLVPTGAHVVAVEPLDPMRGELEAAVPEAEALPGTAEDLPLPDSSVDAVVAAQAFHWFRPVEALAEMARVVRPGGGLSLVWNHWDKRVPWVDELLTLIDWHRQKPHDAKHDWPAVVAASSDRWTPLECVTFDNRSLVDRDGLVGRALSISYLASAPADKQAEVAAGVRDLASGFAEPFALPYVTDVYWGQLRPDPS
jgi:SAM-dependent methyltransferase